jgi:hypothetical protein
MFALGRGIHRLFARQRPPCIKPFALNHRALNHCIPAIDHDGLPGHRHFSSGLLTHEFAVAKAADAYQLICDTKDAVGVALNWS